MGVKTDMAFWLLYIFIIIQRLTELYLAKCNEVKMKRRGAIEVGGDHYKYIVTVHLLFFISFFTEYVLSNKSLSVLWPMLLFIFVFTQAIRVWALYSLGEYWNTKIIILPNADIVAKGPYKYIRHPNYAIVALEILIIPLLFNCYITSIVFTFLNSIVLSIRISVEEKALMDLLEYKQEFSSRSRFLPVRLATKTAK